MYEVGQENAEMKRALLSVVRKIDDGDIDGFCLILHKRNEGFSRVIFPGSLHMLSWVGITDIVKNTISEDCFE